MDKTFWMIVAFTMEELNGDFPGYPDGLSWDLIAYLAGSYPDRITYIRNTSYATRNRAVQQTASTFKVVNTTPTLSVSGTITGYRQRVVPELLSIGQFFSIDAGATQSGVVRQDYALMTAPPANPSDCMYFQSVTYEAKHGALATCVPTFARPKPPPITYYAVQDPSVNADLDIDNNGLRKLYNATTFTSSHSGTTSSVTPSFSPTEEPRLQVNSNYRSGFFITGLGDDASFTWTCHDLNQEEMNGNYHNAAIMYAGRTAGRDEKFLGALHDILVQMPPICEAKHNFLGSLLKSGLSALSSVAGSVLPQVFGAVRGSSTPIGQVARGLTSMFAPQPRSVSRRAMRRREGITEDEDEDYVRVGRHRRGNRAVIHPDGSETVRVRIRPGEITRG